ncbi:MAG: CorA family divalent cation transporter [Myxococcota bacterium]
MHDLALEDVVNLGQRPKVEEYDGQLFVVLGMPCFRNGSLEIVQISLFAGENYLICFCPLADDPFEPVRRRLRLPNNQRIRSRRTDYLLYALIDLIVDQGFPVLESIGERLEARVGVDHRVRAGRVRVAVVLGVGPLDVAAAIAERLVAGEGAELVVGAVAGEYVAGQGHLAARSFEDGGGVVGGVAREGRVPDVHLAVAGP